MEKREGGVILNILAGSIHGEPVSEFQWAGEHFIFLASCLGPLRVNSPIYIQLHC